LAAIRERCAATVEEAVTFATESPWPKDEDVWEDIYV